MCQSVLLLLVFPFIALEVVAAFKTSSPLLSTATCISAASSLSLTYPNQLHPHSPPHTDLSGMDHQDTNLPSKPLCAGRRRKLPEKLIVGYANWNQCDDSIVRAVEEGVNVLIWFSINLIADENGSPMINNGPDMDCVAEKVKIMRDKGLDVVHLISVGGWNSPHPDTKNSAEVVFENWERWNKEFVSRPELGFYGFDGIDWDIEGKAAIK